MKTAMEFAFDLADGSDEELRVHRRSNASREVALDGESKRFVIEDYWEGRGEGETAEEAAVSFLQSRSAQLKKRIVDYECRLAKLREERDRILETYPQFANEDIEETPNE